MLLRGQCITNPKHWILKRKSIQITHTFALFNPSNMSFFKWHLDLLHHLCAAGGAEVRNIQRSLVPLNHFPLFPGQETNEGPTERPNGEQNSFQGEQKLVNQSHSCGEIESIPPFSILFFVDFKGYRTSTFYSFWSKELGQKKRRCKNIESFFWEKRTPLGYLEVENSTIHTGLHPWTLTCNPKDPGGLEFGRWFSFFIRWFLGSKSEFSGAQWNQPIKTISIRYQ